MLSYGSQNANSDRVSYEKEKFSNCMKKIISVKLAQYNNLATVIFYLSIITFSNFCFIWNQRIKTIKLWIAYLKPATECSRGKETEWVKHGHNKEKFPSLAVKVTEE